MPQELLPHRFNLKHLFHLRLCAEFYESQRIMFKKAQILNSLYRKSFVFLLSSSNVLLLSLSYSYFLTSYKYSLAFPPCCCQVESPRTRSERATKAPKRSSIPPLFSSSRKDDTTAIKAPLKTCFCETKSRELLQELLLFTAGIVKS